jgi:hypothetical protein
MIAPGFSPFTNVPKVRRFTRRAQAIFRVIHTTCSYDSRLAGSVEDSQAFKGKEDGQLIPHLDYRAKPSEDELPVPSQVRQEPRLMLRHFPFAFSLSPSRMDIFRTRSGG